MSDLQAIYEIAYIKTRGGNVKLNAGYYDRAF